MLVVPLNNEFIDVTDGFLRVIYLLKVLLACFLSIDYVVVMIPAELIDFSWIGSKFSSLLPFSSMLICFEIYIEALLVKLASRVMRLPVFLRIGEAKAVFFEFFY